MPLSDSEKNKIKKHLGYLQSDYAGVLNPSFQRVNDDATLLSDVQTQITACDTALTNYDSALSGAGKVTQGFGATIDEEGHIKRKARIYTQAIEELARIMAVSRFKRPQEEGTAISGFMGGY